MTRHQTEQAIGHDLQALDVALYFAKGAARRPLLAHKRHCMAQINAWNAEEGSCDLTDDELLAELGA